MNALAFRDLTAIDVDRLKGVGDKKRAALTAVGVESLFDLVTFYPRRWVDRSNEARIADLVPGEEALVLATVRSVTKRVTRNRRTMVNVNVGDGSGRLGISPRSLRRSCRDIVGLSPKQMARIERLYRCIHSRGRNSAPRRDIRARYPPDDPRQCVSDCRTRRPP